MAVASYSASRQPLRERLAYQLRVLRVMASVEFRMKYVDSALGYAWSLAKPLAYFAVLWVVFGRLFDTGIKSFSVYLIVGIVLYMFLIDGVGGMLPSIVNRTSLLRRVSFPAVVIPISASVTAAMTFLINLVAVAIVMAFAGVGPRREWLLAIPLVLELYVFVLGLGLLIAALFVRFRDIGPMWEMVAQLLLFAVPVMYPIDVLPGWAQKAVILNPLGQVIEDARDVLMGDPSTVNAVLGDGMLRVVPVGIAIGTLVASVLLCRREAPSFAERA